ncbi:MAG: hypothetical protein JOZ78_21520 [Chroococcidiopsidaceae cyanobacterium CP_BM_ER_R8_30]|nr:hypothetical protein [Chroococcidiopsidaceae cyanobacterium CP_BM_ER_R8_30]
MLFSDAQEAKKKSLDLTIELVKQQITLASVIVGFAVNFSRGGLPSNIASNIILINIFKASIASLTLSFLCGVITISLISVGVRKNQVDSVLRIKRVGSLGIIQGFLFVCGVILLAVFIISAT